jgi:anti-sigma B factor antagonist/stage II sporulation protein AA (anti-sigma F factor antagonist)
MTIDERREGKAVVLSIDGRLDHEGCQVFDRKVSSLVAAGEKFLVVDFHGVDFLASMGIRALIKPYQALAPQGGRVVVANVCDSVRTVFKIAGIDQAIATFDSVDSAVAAI